MAVVPSEERLSYLLTHPPPSPNSPADAIMVYNLCLPVWQANVPISLTDQLAVGLVCRMNGYGCRDVNCGACRQPLYKWLGAVMDLYVTYHRSEMPHRPPAKGERTLIRDGCTIRLLLSR